MTPDSTFKGLTKNWKTSTGWAMAGLASIIIAASIIPGISLSGLSTFGIFIIALQALAFTKEQSKEWRRKEAIAYCNETERLYKEVKEPMGKILDLAFITVNKTHVDPEDIRTVLTDYNLDTSERVDRIVTNLKIINTHLREMGKEGIGELISTIISLDFNAFVLDVNTFSWEEKDKERMQSSMGEITKLAELAGIKRSPVPSLSLSSIIHNLQLKVIEK